MGGFNPARSAVLSVYTSLIRQSRILNPNLIPKIRKQFKRRRSSASFGHLQAAYELDKDLRAVNNREMSFEQLLSKWSNSRQVKVEQNSIGRRMIWALQPERLWDEYNYPVDTARVKAHAKTANLRANYMKSKNLDSSSADIMAIDTVFAPFWKMASERRHNRMREVRHRLPRKVSIRTVLRSGGELTVLRVQGKKPVFRGFKRHVESISGAPAAEAASYQRLEVQRRILLNRAQFLQTKWNHRFEVRNKSCTTQPSRHKVRLSSVVTSKSIEPMA